MERKENETEWIHQRCGLRQKSNKFHSICSHRLPFSATMRLASSCEFCESAVPGLQLLKVLNTTYILICKIWGLNHAIMPRARFFWRNISDGVSHAYVNKHTICLRRSKCKKPELFVNHYKTTENDPAYMHICVRALVRYAHKHSLHERTKHIHTQVLCIE